MFYLTVDHRTPNFGCPDCSERLDMVDSTRDEPGDLQWSR